MKRLNLFEFEDYPWFPNFLRQYLTLYIVTFHRLIGTCQAMRPLLISAMEKTKLNSIVDICSGGGGPMVDMAREFQKPGSTPVLITLTDLYPNETAGQSIKALGLPNLRYHEQPVNAADVPAELRGIRTMVASFHHMSPDIAAGILKDAFNKQQPVIVF